MSTGLFIATSESYSGKSLVSLGLMRAFLGKTPKVGYFKPIIEGKETLDKDINTIKTHFNLDIPYEDFYCFTRSEVIKKYNQGNEGDIFDSIIRQFEKLSNIYDFVVVEGTDFTENNQIIEFDINVLISKNLGTPVIIVANASEKDLHNITGNLKLAYDSFQQNDVKVLSIVSNLSLIHI